MEPEINEARLLDPTDCVCYDSFRVELPLHQRRGGRRFFRLLDDRPFVPYF